MKVFMGGKSPGEPDKGNDGMKYSAMLIDLAKLYLGPYPTIEEYEDLISIVVEAWNIANIKKLIPDIFPSMLEQAKTKLGDRKLKKLLDNLIRDKIRKYNNQNAFIAEYEFLEKDEEGSDFLLTVKALPMESFLASMAEQVEQDREPNLIDREVVIVRPREPFFDWIRSIEPEYQNIESYEPGTFLIRETEAEEEARAVVEEKFPVIFDLMLRGCIWDESTWPKDRTYEMFLEWFEIQISGIIYDLEDYPVKKG